MKNLNKLINLIVENRSLLLEMTKREIVERFKGQALGGLWAFLYPLVQMGLYIFIFGTIMRVQIGGTDDMPLNYTVYILSGMIPWLFIQESLSRGSYCILSNSNMVKQVIFPIEILPIRAVLTSLASNAISIAILFTYVLIAYKRIPLTYVFLPFAIALEVFTMCGISLLLSSLGVYLRDLKDIVQVATMMGIYMAPVIYLPESVPSLFRPLLYLNPFSYLIWIFQDILYFCRFDHIYAWIISIILCILSLWIGYRTFDKLKIGFGSVL